MRIDLSAALYDISHEIFKGGLSIDECLRIVRQNSGLVENLLTEVFGDQELRCSERQAFAFLDACKSLIVRKLAADRRSQAMGWPEASMYLGMAATIEDIDKYLLRMRRYTLCSLYIGPIGDVSCLLAHFDEESSQPVYRFVKVVDRAEAPRFSRDVEALAKSMSMGQPDFEALDDILGGLGARVIPALQTLPSGQQLILIPHRTLHLVPLHCMHMNVGGQRVYVDEVVHSISYSSSVVEMYSPRIVAGPQGFERQGLPRLLVVLDMAADLRWLESERKYYEGLKQTGLPIDIVTSSQQLPENLSPYIWITWGGHAISNPMNWGGSILRLGDREISATEIASEWTCAKPWVLLGACQTSVDLSEVQRVDEYCGLDLAFYIAGAFGVYSTMWPVRDATAAFSDVFLSNEVFAGHKQPPRALTIMQRRLRHGDWKTMMTRDASQFPTGLQETFRLLQSVPDDAFKSLHDWGVFRSYGVS